MAIKKSSTESYNPGVIEQKWQKEWEKRDLYATSKTPKNKKYILDMFPYPSGATLHVGHVEGYVGTDILSRFEKMKGSDILHPMGWDAFGLPAENYAIKTGINPNQSTHNNIKIFKRQLINTGLSYDWNREIDTSNPEFYKWTQWLFILMYKRGLAYKKLADVNWCPSCETVLANEQVVEGKCERCDTIVVQKKLSQWFLKITEYADRLISGLDTIDWPEGVKVQQKNWIGKSEGAEISFRLPITAGNEAVDGRRKIVDVITVFTTRPDTLYGATFLVLSTDSEWVDRVTTKEQKNDVLNYLKIERKNTKEKTGLPGGTQHAKSGVFTGSYAINPANGEKIPIWVADYVLGGYGSGAVMGVPAHDGRDFEFAKKYKLQVKWVIEPLNGTTNKDEAYIGEGKIINSKEWNGWITPGSIGKIVEWLDKKGTGKRRVQYHLRDWLISRQRYWGAPIPMIHCPKCAEEGKSWFTTKEAKEYRISDFGFPGDVGWYPVPETQLPVVLPKEVDFRPTGESPIIRSKEFQEGVVCPNCGIKAVREVDTMDTYVDSSWYFIRFADPKNTSEFASKEAIKQWLPVDTYVGGGHAVQHLLFARFFWKVLFDAELLDKSVGDEPFVKLRAPGWILGSDSRKMSKRWGNIVTPDDIIPKYGADTLRLYEMFMGPFDAMKPWNLTGVEGMWRFVNRVWRLVVENENVGFAGEKDREAVVRAQHKTIQSVTNDIEELHFNTAIASLMEFVNLLQDTKTTIDHRPQTTEKRETENGRRKTVDEWANAIKTLLLLLAPFAPYMAEELFQFFRNSKHEIRSTKFESVHFQPWPKYNPELIQEETVEIPVQINGKLRGTIVVLHDQGKVQKEVETQARGLDNVSKHLEGKKINKVIFIPSRLINFVVS